MNPLTSIPKLEPSVTIVYSPNTPSPSLVGKRAAVIVFSYFPSDPRVFREALALAEAGAAVHVFCLRKTDKAGFLEPAIELVNGIYVTRANIKKSRAGKLSYVKQYVAFTAAAFAWLSLQRRYDLVHVHNMPDFLIFSALVAKLLGSKVVLDLHDPMPEVFLAKDELKPGGGLLKLLRWIEKKSIAFADLVLTPNLAFREVFASRSGPKEKIEIIMNTPLEEVFPLTAPAAAPLARTKKDPFVLMYHGTLFERHGLHMAMEALADLVDDFPGFVFKVYGAETPYWTKTIVPLIEELHLEKHVQYFGDSSQEAIARAIRECDLGLVPNLKTPFTEINFPVRIFEYLALGKPVLVPFTRGIRDYFGPENMLFFRRGINDEEEEEENLASAIRWVFEHPEETRTLVEKGQEVYRRHPWRAERGRFLRLISQLLG
jgi:glycosyltransferase involved in cell wall biosynthesis